MGSLEQTIIKIRDPEFSSTQGEAWDLDSLAKISLRVEGRALVSLINYLSRQLFLNQAHVLNPYFYQKELLNIYQTN